MALDGFYYVLSLGQQSAYGGVLVLEHMVMTMANSIIENNQSGVLIDCSQYVLIYLIISEHMYVCIDR